MSYHFHKMPRKELIEELVAFQEKFETRLSEEVKKQKKQLNEEKAKYIEASHFYAEQCAQIAYELENKFASGEIDFLHRLIEEKRKEIVSKFNLKETILSFIPLTSSFRKLQKINFLKQTIEQLK